MSGAKDPEKEAEPPPPPSFGKVVGAVGQPWGEVPQPMMPIWAAESLKEQVDACRARYTEVRFSCNACRFLYFSFFFLFAIRFLSHSLRAGAPRKAAVHRSNGVCSDKEAGQM